MPAHALRPQPGWTVVDCCAAPGNKTTHAAALVGPSGRVLAFDKDPKRLKRLQANAKTAGAVSIEAQCTDFLELDPSEPRFAEVGVLINLNCAVDVPCRYYYYSCMHQMGKASMELMLGLVMPSACVDQCMAAAWR